MSSFNNNNNTQNPTNSTTEQQQRRFVLFLGPSKTASTSLQRFFSTYANVKSKDFIPAFQQWNYPLFLGSHAGLRYLDDPSKQPILHKTFRNQVKHGYHIITGSEFLASHHRFLGGHLFATLQNWTDGVPPEIVILLRSPRVEHWISCWKQGSQIKGKDTYGVSFEEMLCNPNYEVRLQRILARTTNPLQIAYETSVEHNLRTTVVDMYGVSHAGFDVSHVVACEIMNVPCVAEDTPWVLGLGHTTIHANVRKGNAHLSTEKAQAMEWVFQQRDCAFYAELANHPQFRLIHRHDGGLLWGQEHCPETETLPWGTVFRYNATILIQELRKRYQCPAGGQLNDRVNASSNTTTTATVLDALEKNGHPMIHGGNNTIGIVHQEEGIERKERVHEPPTSIRMDTTNVAMMTGLAVGSLFFVAGLLLCRRRCHRRWQQQQDSGCGDERFPPNGSGAT